MIPEPSGCAWCGRDRHSHGWTWHPDAGLHKHTPPTDAQRLARMRARRTARTTTEEHQ